MKTNLRKVSGFSAEAADKLLSSGITVEQATALGMYDVGNAATLDPAFDGAPALVLPYYNADKKLMKAHPAWPEFYRIRYLSSGFGFGDMTEGKKPRYSQPANTGVCAYLPLCTDWKAIQKDYREPVCITEGELKAAKACLEGFPTIGLGGVYNFRAAKRGMFWLPELEAFDWARRRTIICYDSDYASKPDICGAINVLAEELQERGALVELATLPDVYDDDRKTGLDDFLVARDADALVKVLAAADPLAMSTTLWRMNDQIVYIEDPGFIVDQKTRQKITPNAFTQHSAYSTANTPERKVRPDGQVSFVKASAAPIWMKWPLRRSASKLTYRPGQPLFCEGEFNQWKGWGCEPKKGDVKPWLELIKFIFEGADKEAIEWFLDWCAYPLQKPGSKLFSAVVVHGRMTGTGKTLIGYTLAKIYGGNFTKIKNEDLKDTWWAENRQFVLGDEISGSDKRSESDALKAMITQEEVNINIKYVPQFTIPDCVNYYFTSNHADAFFLEDEDRRYFVHEVTARAPLPQAFYSAYEAWKEGDGPAALFHWLLQRDLSKFNPKAPAYRTAARERMAVQSKSDLGLWCYELMSNPDAKLRVGQMRHTRDLFTSTELLAMYNSQTDHQGKPVTVNGMSRTLGQAGAVQVYSGSPITLPDGTQGRYFAIRNTAQWAGCKNTKELIRNIQKPPVRS